jgi:hypothetical protein
VLDVDRHVGVDLGQCPKELGPELGAVAAADGHEVPGGALRPAAQGVLAAQRQGAGVVAGDPPETVVEYAVELGRPLMRVSGGAL